MDILLQVSKAIRQLLQLPAGSVRAAKQNAPYKVDESYVLVDLISSNPMGTTQCKYKPKRDNQGTVIDDIDEIIRTTWRWVIDVQFYNYSKNDTLTLYQKLTNQFKSDVGKTLLRELNLGFAGLGKGNDFSEQVNGKWIPRFTCDLTVYTDSIDINTIKEYKVFRTKNLT